MVRWGQAAPGIDIKAIADRVYRTDIYRAAAREMGVACPTVDRKAPGGHGEPFRRSDDKPAADRPAGSAPTFSLVYFRRRDHDRQQQRSDAAASSRAPPPRRR